MSAPAVAQINVRLPRELKEQGDASLRELGLSPSDAVRSLWGRLAQRGEGLADTQAFLLGEDPDAGRIPIAFEQSVLAEGWRMVDSSLTALGVRGMSVGEAEDGGSDNDLLVEALEERMAERGLM